MFKRATVLLAILFLLTIFSNTWAASAGTSPPLIEETQTAKTAAFNLLQQKLLQSEHVRIIIVFNSPKIQNLSMLDASRKAMIAVRQNEILNTLPLATQQTAHKFKYTPGMDLVVDQASLQLLYDNNLVTSIQEDIPEDPLFTTTGPITTTGPTLKYTTSRIGADSAWNLGYTAQDQVIVILDSGVDKDHESLNGKVIAEACFSANVAPVTSLCPNGQDTQIGSGAGVPCSISGCEHGTMVAGVAAGNGSSDGQYGPGVARDAKIISIQVFANYLGTLKTFPSLQIRAFEHILDLAATYNIAAVNMSLGTGEYTSVCDNKYSIEKAYIDQLKSMGIAVIAAAGNSDFTDNKSATHAPACISSVIGVGGSIPDDSGIAAGSASTNFLDFWASYFVMDLPVPGPSNSYSGLGSGTSFSAPQVAGAWAILKSLYPINSSFGYNAIKNALTVSGLPITDSANGVTKPRIQIDAAINALPPLPVEQVTLTSTGPYIVGLPMTFTAQATGGTGTPEYRFYISDSQGFRRVQDYSTTNTWAWTPAEADINSAAFVFVYVRNTGYPDWVVNSSQLIQNIQPALPAPAIGSFSPASGAPGTLGIVYGSNLCDQSCGANSRPRVTLNGIEASVGYADSSHIFFTVPLIFFTVPKGATTAPITVTTPWGSTASNNDFVIPPPHAILYTLGSSSSGAIGENVAFAGKNLCFKGYCDLTDPDIKVRFNGVVATQGSIATGIPNYIFVTVPQGATTGLVTITTPWGSATTDYDFVIPDIVINHFSPASGAPGTLGIIYGSNLCDQSCGANSRPRVTLNGVEASVGYADPSRIFFTVPQGATTGPVTVTTPRGSTVSKNDFVIPPYPILYTLGSSSSGAIGENVAFAGKNLCLKGYCDLTDPDIKVRFNGVVATQGSIATGIPNYILVTVPQGATTGSVTMTTPWGSATTDYDFVVIQ